MDRIMNIVNYLHSDKDALVAFLLEKSCLLNVDEIEVQSIKEVFMTKKEDLLK